MNCTVLRANTAAMNVFGAARSSASPHLSAIWPAENGGPPDQFFARWQQYASPTADLKLRVASGATVKFTAAICAFGNDGQKWFVLQLLPSVEPASVSAATGIAPSVLPAPAEIKIPVEAGGVALKQKLDCALQLARTVSLDFNNALTSVLGHTSLLLSKAEPGHPWRHSLMEVEKSAARAAEISNELGVFSQQEKQTRRVPPGNLNEVAIRCVKFFKNTQGEKVAWNLNLEKELFGSRFDEA